MGRANLFAERCLRATQSMMRSSHERFKADFEVFFYILYVYYGDSFAVTFDRTIPQNSWMPSLQFFFSRFDFGQNSEA